MTPPHDLGYTYRRPCENSVDIEMQLPAMGIDLWSFQNLISVFERMRQVRSDRTILVISHQERILNIADEIIVLAEGKIVSHGSRAEILPTLLGTPSAVSACAQLEKTTGKEGNC